MAQSFIPLANLTLSSTATTVNFTGFTAYKNVVIIVTSISGSNLFVSFNNDATANSYLYQRFFLSGTTPTGAVTASTRFNVPGNSGSVSSAELNFMNLDSAGSKGFSARAGESYGMTVGSWNGTAAVTSIQVTANTTFSIGTSFAIYGVATV